MKKVTPMVAQYLEIKKQYSDAILLFRLGDFYEMFYEDALVASKILQITLTRRNKSDPDQIMCGIPFHASENYIGKLSAAGKKVAICEQLTKPDGKGIVKRDVIRVITPGTSFDESVIDKKSNNFVCALALIKDKYSMAYADLGTGDFYCNEFDSLKELSESFNRINPRETIIKDSDKENFLIFQNYQGSVFYHLFQEDAPDFLKKHFNVFSLSVFDIEESFSLQYVSAFLYSYLLDTQKCELKHISKIQRENPKNTLLISNDSLKNLEVFYSVNGDKNFSLFQVLDTMQTAMGSRRLRNLLISPIASSQILADRLLKVEIFYDDSDLNRETIKALSEIADIERLLAKIGIGTSSPRDILALKNSISAFSVLNSLNRLGENFKLFELNELFDYLDRAIMEDAQINIRDGGFIKKGFNKELDEIRTVLYEGKDFISKMQEREIKRSGISNLKIRFNKVFGYYIEISKGNLKNVPDDFIRKQTLVNAERFITPELKEYEDKVLSASERVNELEAEIFHAVRFRVLENLKELQKNAKIIADIDLFSGFAFSARKNNFVKPQVDDSLDLIISEGRHPILEMFLGQSDFVSNDTNFDNKNNFILLTGPNMGGKSTFLKQNALIVLMAHIGSFVPAKNARIGVVNKIFTRVGASDNMARGESTFMVEMQEASFILNNADERSLVILDEIGRGTSTYDGLSIAWAICEYICENIKSKTIFATHYHELTELIDSIEKAKNFSVQVVEKNNNEIVFLYKIIEGCSSRSYGIEVAKLSGLPQSVILRATQVLRELEKKSLRKFSNKESIQNQLSMFNEEREKNSKIKKELEGIDINSLTPISALNKLNEIKDFIKKNG